MDKPVRHTEWRSFLIQYVDDIRHRPFKFGELDCALFAAGAIHAMTHVDLSDGLRGYTTEEEGLAQLRSKGYESHIAYAKSIFPVVHKSHASVGDIAVVKLPGGLVMGIVGGARIFLIHETHGLFTIDLMHSSVKEILKV